MISWLKKEFNIKKIIYPLFLFTILFTIGCEVGVSQKMWHKNVMVEKETYDYNEYQRKGEETEKIIILHPPNSDKPNINTP